MHARRLRPPLHSAFASRAWLRTLGIGLALYLVVTIATVATHNLHLAPSVLLFGALLVPVTFVVYVYERVRSGRRCCRPWRAAGAGSLPRRPGCCSE